MPNTKSAIRRVRRVKKQTQVNRMRRSKYKHAIKQMDIYLKAKEKDKAKKYLEGIQENAFQINHDMASRMKNQLRRMPKFCFYIDDSLDYVEGIERALKEPENPIKNSELL